MPCDSGVLVLRIARTLSPVTRACGAAGDATNEDDWLAGTTEKTVSAAAAYVADATGVISDGMVTELPADASAGWVRMLVIEPMPTLLKAAKKQGSASKPHSLLGARVQKDAGAEVRH